MKTLKAVIIICFASTLSFAQNTKENADLKLAMNLYNDKMYDLALEQFKQFIANNPQSALASDARFYLGLTQRATGKLADARATFQNFALTYADNPRAPEAFWYVGELFVQDKKFADAASAFERIKVFYPKSSYAPKGLLQAADLFDRANDPDNAIKVLKSLFSDYPSDELVPAGHLKLGMLYLKQNNFTGARSELSSASEAGVNKDLKATVTLQLGTLAEQMGNGLEAEKLYHAVFEDKTAPALAAAQARIALATLLSTAGRSSEATEQLKRVTIDSSNVPAAQRSQILASLAHAYESQRDSRHAAELWERYLSSPSETTDSTFALLHAGNAYAGAKDWKRAFARYTTASERPGLSIVELKEALLRGASAATALGDNATAAQYYQKFAETAPADADAPDALYRASSLLRSPVHDLPAAATVLKKLIATYPRSPRIDEAVFTLARTLEEQAKPEQAIELYDEILQHYPASDYTDQAQARREMLRQVSAVDKNETFRLLAGILGDMMADKPKSELAMRLGDLYFDRLKDYTAAEAQYAKAESLGLDENSKEAAAYRRVLSVLKNSDVDTTKRDQARTAVEEYLKSPHNKKYFEDASFDLFSFQARTAAPDVLIQQARQIIGEHPYSPRLAEVRLLMARALEARGSMPESIDAYKQILTLHPSSPECDEAAARLGIQLARFGRTDSALAVMNSYLKTHPKGRWNAEVLREKGLTLMTAQKFDEAAAVFEKLGSDYFYTQAASHSESDLARAYRRAGAFEKALAVYHKEETRLTSPLYLEDARRATLMLNLARTYDEAGSVLPASAAYAAFVREYPAHDSTSNALMRLASIEVENGRPESAIHYLEKAVATHRTADNTQQLADLLYENSQYPAALNEYEQLLPLAVDPAQHRMAERRVITSLYRSGKIPEAEAKIKAYEKTYDNDDDATAEFAFEKAMVEFRAQRYTDALSMLKKFPSKYDNTTFVDKSIFWMGKIYEATNQTDSALANYMLVMHSFPKSEMLPKTYLALGNIFYFREQYDDAIKYYRMIVDKPSTAPDLMPYAMNNLIEAYKEVGQNEIALNLTRTFIERYPMHESIEDKKIDLGVLYQKLGYYDRAIVQLQALLETTNKDLESEIRYYLGETYFYKNDYQQAILEFLKVPYLVNKRTKIDWTPNSYYMAGQSYEKMGKYDQALNMYQQIVDKPGIDATFKTAAQKEIARVKGAVGSNTTTQ